MSRDPKQDKAKTAPSRLLREGLEIARGLHRAGAISDARLAEFVAIIDAAKRKAAIR